VSQLTARALFKSYAGRVVIDGLEIVAGPRERLGLVGQNGAGKSTVLRLLAGRERPDGGSIALHGSVAYLTQDPDLPDGETLAGVVDLALADFRSMEARMRELEGRMAAGDESVLGEYGDLLATYETADGWSADARAAKTLAGLGLGDVEPQRPVTALSGGQRARLALALVLVRAPDVLLLDEPTNHLDDDALGFLEGELRERRGVLVAASHDRAFLDAVCTSILDLDPALTIRPDGTPVIGPARHTGAYSDYLAGTAAARIRWEQAYAAWTDEVNGLQAAIKQSARRVGHGSRAPRDNDKFAVHFFGQRVEAAVARRARDAEVRLARLQENRVPKPPAPLRLSATPDPGDMPDGVLLSVRDLHVTGRVALPALDVNADTRLLVTGPNGAGKSSLLAVLAGAIEPDEGRVMYGRGVRIGWLPQEGAFPDPSVPALHAFAAGRPGAPEEHQSELASLGLLAPADLRTPVGRLSVGQQRRLALARLLTARPHVLLLDELTNHLSLSLLEEMEEAVLGSGLAVVVVSHDRWLRRRWSGDRLKLRPVGAGR
jgi:macrolide transport system ATP-binding/permease protein